MCGVWHQNGTIEWSVKFLDTSDNNFVKNKLCQQGIKRKNNDEKDPNYSFKYNATHKSC
jgi:hypothetical protein